MQNLKHTRAKSFLGAILLLAADARLAAVYADDVSDCIKARPDTRIQACSRIIKSKRLFGKPISENKLAMAYNNRGAAYSRVGRVDQALSDFTQAIWLNREYAKAYYNRATGYVKKDRIADAISDYSTAIRLDPKMVRAYHNRANLYRGERLFKKAVADYTKAIELFPNLVLAYHNRGLAYEQSGQREKAIADYRKANELFPAERLGDAGLKRLGVKP